MKQIAVIAIAAALALPAMADGPRTLSKEEIAEAIDRSNLRVTMPAPLIGPAHMSQEDIASAVKTGDATVMIADGTIATKMPNAIAPETMNDAILSFKPVVRSTPSVNRVSVKAMTVTNCKAGSTEPCDEQVIDGQRKPEPRACIRTGLDDAFTCK